MRQPAPHCQGPVKRHLQLLQPVVQYLPSRRYASWPRTSVLILRLSSGAALVE